MKTVECPINVVVYSPKGKADNHDCTGPSQLQTWLNEGRVQPHTQVFERRTEEWMTVESYLRWTERRSDVETLHDMDATLTDLVGVAEELKKLTALAAKREQENDRSRDFRKHRKAERSDGNSDKHNERHGSIVRQPVECAYPH
tara:strand:- start:3783 stop:4214 length:432 start_codon:yes stop_codon:yes gene_type:complete